MALEIYTKFWGCELSVKNLTLFYKDFHDEMIQSVISNKNWKVLVWFSLELKFNCLELDFVEEGQLV